MPAKLPVNIVDGFAWPLTNCWWCWPTTREPSSCMLWNCRWPPNDDTFIGGSNVPNEACWWQPRLMKSASSTSTGWNRVRWTSSLGQLVLPLTNWCCWWWWWFTIFGCSAWAGAGRHRCCCCIIVQCSALVQCGWICAMILSLKEEEVGIGRKAISGSHVFPHLPVEHSKETRGDCTWKKHRYIKSLRSGTKSS